MITMYAKLFSRITESSLMEEPILVRYTFVLMLAIADPKGYVIGTDVAIARRLNLTLLDFRQAIEVLMAPDPDSNSKEEEGRRVIQSDGERGYKLVNFLTYRDMTDQDKRREYMKEYMRKKRASAEPLAPVSLPLAASTQGEESGKPEEEKKKEAGAHSAAVTVSNAPVTQASLLQESVGLPTQEEFVAECVRIGVPTQFAIDKFLAKLEKGFERNWKPYAARVLGWYREKEHMRSQGNRLAPPPTKKPAPVYEESRMNREVRELMEEEERKQKARLAAEKEKSK